MSDREDVVDLLHRYATGIDGRDWQLLRSCFTDDCVLDYGGIGSWTDADEFVTVQRRSHSGPSLHRLTNMVVRLPSDDPDRATARTYVDAVVTGRSGVGGVHVMGQYHDVLHRTPEGWRIAARSFDHMRLTILGPLRVLPSALASRLALGLARRVNPS